MRNNEKQFVLTHRSSHAQNHFEGPIDMTTHMETACSTRRQISEVTTRRRLQTIAAAWPSQISQCWLRITR